MNARALKIGDTIEVDAADGKVAGVVATFRIARDRQIVGLKTADGLRTMALNIADDNKPDIVVPPLDPIAARHLALAVLAGDDRRMPVTAAASLLAGAVVTLTGGVA